jgi:hypothetical protein
MSVVGRNFGPFMTLTIGGVPCDVTARVDGEGSSQSRLTCILRPTPGGQLLVQGHDPVLGNSAGDVFLTSGLGSTAQRALLAVVAALLRSCLGYPSRGPSRQPPPPNCLHRLFRLPFAHVGLGWGVLALSWWMLPRSA